MNSQVILPARVEKRHIPNMYRWIAPTHDWLAVLVEARARHRGIEKAEIKDGQVILEVAVGTGLSFKELLKLNPSGHNTGVDLTPAMLKRAKHRAHKSRAGKLYAYTGRCIRTRIQ